MAISIQITGRETIKPSSPTPDHLRSYKLSFLDQLSPAKYSCIVLFYPPTSPKSSQYPIFHDQLKSSLSKTLTHFYPLAGQFNDTSSINCNDHGACYVEATVACDLPEFLVNHLYPDPPAQLLPFRPVEKSADPVDQRILGVQVNKFACGGFAIGACIWHTIADGAALASFLSIWAAIARGGGLAGPDGVVTVADISYLFPPKDMTGFSTTYFKRLQDNVFTNKFLFDRSKVDLLKEKLGNGRAPPTGFQALVALIWGALIAIYKSPAGETTHAVDFHIAYCTVNLRSRMEPPWPRHCIGNNVQTVTARWRVDAPMDHYLAARRIGDLIREVDDGYIRELYSGDAYFNAIKRIMEEQPKETPMPASNIFTSMCKFPFHDVDFGFGKPCRIAPVLSQRNLTIFIDAQEGGGGVEAWIALSKEDMAKFEKDPAIVEYATFTPST